MLDNKILLLEIDPLVEEGIKAIETITGQIIEIGQEAGGTTIGQVIEVVITQITTDEVIQDHSIDKTHNGHLETEVQSRSGNENYGNNQYRGRSRDRN